MKGILVTENTEIINDIECWYVLVSLSTML